MDFDPLLFTPIIDRILKGSELSAVSAKDVRKSLQKELGYDISEHKAQVTDLIRQRFDLILDESGGPPSEPEYHSPVYKSESPPTTNGHDTKKTDTKSTPSKKRKSVASPSVDDDARLAAKLQAEWNSQGRPSRSAAPKRKAAPVKKKKSKATISDDEGTTETKKKRKVNPNNPFNHPLALSPQLSAFFGGETQLSRPETVKRIWAYVKENGLQDQSDKRYIICDDNLRTVFGSNKVHMFTMNKILSGHLYPLDPSQRAAVKTEGSESVASPASNMSGQDSPASFESEAS